MAKRLKNSTYNGHEFPTSESRVRYSSLMWRAMTRCDTSYDSDRSADLRHLP